MDIVNCSYCGLQLETNVVFVSLLFVTIDMNGLLLLTSLFVYLLKEIHFCATLADLKHFTG